MQIYPLSTLERQQGGFTHKIVLMFDDLTETATNTAQAITMLTLPIGTLVRNLATRMVTAFTDASDAAFNTTALTIGDAGSANRYLASQELNSNGTEVFNKAGTGTQLAYDTAGSLIATFASMSAKALNDIDAGEIHIFVQIVNLVQLAGA